MFAAFTSNPWSSTWNLLSDGVAIIIIAAAVYMLFKPYKEANKLTVK